MHNNHFYDCTNEDDLKLEKIIREKAKTSNWYKKMIEVWLDRDVRKLEYAKKNKLNYIVLWTEEELDQHFLPGYEYWKNPLTINFYQTKSQKEMNKIMNMNNQNNYNNYGNINILYL